MAVPFNHPPLMDLIEDIPGKATREWPRVSDPVQKPLSPLHQAWWPISLQRLCLATLLYKLCEREEGGLCVSRTQRQNSSISTMTEGARTKKICCRQLAKDLGGIHFLPERRFSRATFRGFTPFHTIEYTKRSTHVDVSPQKKNFGTDSGGWKEHPHKGRCERAYLHRSCAPLLVDSACPRAPTVLQVFERVRRDAAIGSW